MTNDDVACVLFLFLLYECDVNQLSNINKRIYIHYNTLYDIDHTTYHSLSLLPPSTFRGGAVASAA